MPRKKTTAPARLTEEEQQSSTWRMGEQPQVSYCQFIAEINLRNINLNFYRLMTVRQIT